MVPKVFASKAVAAGVVGSCLRLVGSPHTALPRFMLSARGASFWKPASSDTISELVARSEQVQAAGQQARLYLDLTAHDGDDLPGEWRPHDC